MFCADVMIMSWVCQLSKSFYSRSKAFKMKEAVPNEKKGC